jgi:hypothetical protein
MAISLECNVRSFFSTRFPSITHLSFPLVRIQVPVLVNEWMRQTYTFLDDDRVIVTRPQALREIFAIKALRTGQWFPRPNVQEHLKEVAVHAERMIEKGWIRSAEQFAEFKEGIWKQNAHAVRRILNDID